MIHTPIRYHNTRWNDITQIQEQQKEQKNKPLGKMEIVTKRMPETSKTHSKQWGETMMRHNGNKTTIPDRES
jgi:hypothetical protein